MRQDGAPAAVPTVDGELDEERVALALATMAELLGVER